MTDEYNKKIRTLAESRNWRKKRKKKMNKI